MAYGVIMLYHLHMPSYILRTFTEYPYVTIEGSLLSAFIPSSLSEGYQADYGMNIHINFTSASLW